MHAIACNRSNAKPPHLSGRVGDNPVAIVQRHAETAIRKNFVYETLER